MPQIALRRTSRELGGPVLVWACLAAAGVGFAIGVHFRVTMLLAAAVLLSVATIAVAIYTGWSVSRTVAVLFLLLAIQQAAYLLGLYAAMRR
jgi:hypothetical protein